jgi:hypothetical protein
MFGEIHENARRGSSLNGKCHENLVKTAQIYPMSIMFCKLNLPESQKARNSRTTSNSMFERNSRNGNNTIGYNRNVSNSRETSNIKPSGT